MKLKLLTPIAILCAGIVITSCKKGEDDPSFSIYTRKARVVGEWKVNSGSYKHITTGVTGSSLADFYSYTETDYTETQDVDGQSQPNVYKGSYSRTLKFERDGSVRIRETYDNQSIVINGTWDFNNGIGTDKKKVLLMIHFKNTTLPVGMTTYSGQQKNMTYYIRELKNKKMVLQYQDKQVNSDGSSESYEESLELKQ